MKKCKEINDAYSSRTSGQKYALIQEVLNTAKRVDAMAKKQGIEQIRIVKERKL